MRVFLGFPVPDQTRQYVQELQAFLQRHGVRGKWVDPASLHLTVQFLGEVDEAALDALSRELRGCADQWPAPVLCYGSVGGFSVPPRLLFLGWEESRTGGYARLSEGVRLAAISVGILLTDADLAREPKPHLTLVRFRDRREAATLKCLTSVVQGRLSWQTQLPQSPDGGRLDCRDLTLYQSILTRVGPEYRVLAKFALAADL
jgi:2'-5' RNA ligase